MNLLRRLKPSRHADRKIQQEFRTARVSPREPRTRYLSVACIARNEGPHLREWLEFHLMMGVEHFTFYDNCSTDGTAEILEPYVRSGLVEVIPWPHFVPDYDTQALAYAHALGHTGPSTRWLAFFDLDEYMFAPDSESLPELLREYEDLPALVVYWAVFGTSGRMDPAPGLLMEHFTERAPIPEEPVIDPILANYKSIVQPEFVLRNRGAHNFIVSADGSSGFDETRQRIFRKNPRRVTMQRIRLNHYYTRSRREWLSRSGRTEGTGTVARHEFLRGAFEKVERCPVEDREILRYLPRLRRTLGGPVRQPERVPRLASGSARRGGA